LLLLGIGIALLREGAVEERGHHEIGTLAAAIRTILLADVVMSLDNVLAVAAAANGSLLLLVIGLVVSVPLIVFGSTLLLKVMDRFPVIVMLGAALLGFLAGEMMLTDPAVLAATGAISPAAVNTAGVVGAVLVVAVGLWMRRRTRAGASV